MAIAAILSRRPAKNRRIRRKRRRSTQEEQARESGLHGTSSELQKIINNAPQAANPSAKLIETVNSGSVNKSANQTAEQQTAGKSPPDEADATTQDLSYPGYLMRPGSIGEGVRTAQMMLNANGDGLETDGIFGPLTLQAVVQFQRSNTLLVDGIIGPQTWGALVAGSTTKDTPPDDYSDYTSELQELFRKLFDANNSPEEFNKIITQIFANFPAPPQVSGQVMAVSDVAQPGGADGVEAILAQVEILLNAFNAGLPAGSIYQRNLMIRSLQAGTILISLTKNYPAAVPIVGQALTNNELRKQMIAAILFINAAEGYKRMLTGIIKLKKTNAEAPEDLAARMAFVHRAMTNIGAIESHADSGERAGATIGKDGYTKDNPDKPKTSDLDPPLTFPLRKGYELFDKMWTEAVDVGYYKENDQFQDRINTFDRLRLLYPPDLPSWCGIYVNWIAIQEGLATTKWKQGGTNVDYIKWKGGYEMDLQHPPKAIHPGDILLADTNNRSHQCIAISYDPQTGKITSIDGNTSPDAASTGGQILVQERAFNFFKWVLPFKGRKKAAP